MFLRKTVAVQDFNSTGYSGMLGKPLFSCGGVFGCFAFFFFF